MKQRMQPSKPAAVPWGQRFGLSITLALLGFLSASATWAQSTSPGPLAQSHAKLDNNCGKCHTAGQGASDDRCLDCHKVAKSSNYHSQMAKESGKTCAGCHHDHRGRDFTMIRWQPPANFPHEKTSWPLKGAHQTPACSACHTTVNRWMGLTGACADCHRDLHVPSLGPRCQDCHNEQHFSGADRFDHAQARFALTGKHARVACAKCHKAQGIAGVWKGIAFANCSSCHAEPKAGHSGGQDCAACHNSQGWGTVNKDAQLRLHARTRLPLQGKHAEIACEKCHTAERGGLPLHQAERTVIPPTAKLDPNCTACHTDIHDRKLGANCTSCHGFSDWALNAGVGFDHNRTGYKLEGLHRKVACSACHPPGLPARKRLHGVDGNNCMDCHKDPHGGPFLSVMPSNRCETCHTVQGFAPPRYSVADHDRSTYALTGGHRVTPCQPCHQPPPAKSMKLHGVSHVCADCHRDPHGGQFQQDGVLRPCQNCHDVQTFVPTRGFDHNLTKMPLTGSHANVQCNHCHFRPAEKEPVQFTGLRNSCATCHRDVHQGQFATAGPIRSCEDCHRPEGKFRIPSFDHGKTRFALDGKHRNVACAKCHRPVPGPQGKSTTHWRLGPMSCEQCHKNPHQARVPAEAQP